MLSRSVIARSAITTSALRSLAAGRLVATRLYSQRTAPLNNVEQFSEGARARQEFFMKQHRREQMAYMKDLLKKHQEEIAILESKVDELARKRKERLASLQE